MKYTDNVMTYLKWRGDLTLQQSPFNEVDALILAELVYIELDDIVPQIGEHGSITIHEAGKIFHEKHTMKELEDNFAKVRYTPYLFFELMKCPRFMNMTLSNYVSEINYEKEEQFAAMHINMGHNTTYIAFRGTDDDLVGWKENFNMSFMMPVPAQKSAVDYVNRTAKGILNRFYIGGHSKGGNLSIYAGVFCNTQIQKKIMKIYSFDGPGFNRSMVDNSEYIRMQDKIHSFVPETSVIGILMEHQEEYTVVNSNEVGILQHDGMSWKVNGTVFEYAKDRDKTSQYADATINAWIAQISPEERERFVNALFSVFEQAGIQYLSDVSSMSLKKIGSLLKVMTTISTDDRDIILRIMKLLWNEGNKKRIEKKTT